MDLMTGSSPERAEKVSSIDEVLSARSVVSKIYIDDTIRDYIIDVVHATREPRNYGLVELAPLIDYGASPRASIFLATAARAHAFLRHRGYVTPEDVKAVGQDVLRHRVVLTYEAEAEEISSEDVIRRLFEHVEVP
jgi:MoxR-like ATPase